MVPSEHFTDSPISAPEADVLRRGPFVSAILGEFQAWPGNTGLVVGLHGRWGDGKTSVVNLLEKRLVENGFRVLHFNPWEWSKNEDLTDSFFDEVSVQLGRPSRKENEELAKAMRRYAARLKGGASTVLYLLPFIKVVLWVSTLLWFVDIWTRRVWLPVIAALISALAAVTVAFSKLLPKVADVVSPADNENLPSLVKLKSDLVSALRRSDDRFVVVMDDIDRLAPSQLADVTRLVKANGDLPRVGFLLVGDRQVMADHLSASLSVDGAEYLEKIIQLGFDLPVIGRDALNTVFWSGLNEILSDEVMSRNFEADRWRRVYWAGLATSLCNLRNVKRFLASLRVTFALLRGSRVIEVNQVDFIAIEAIRIFEPSLYRSIARSKDALTRSVSDRKDFEAVAGQALSALFRDVKSERQRQWTSLLQLLFPFIDVARGHITYGPHNMRAFAAAQRVCSPTYFDRYFRFGLGTDEISTSEVQGLLDPVSCEECRVLLEKFASEGKLLDLMDRMRERVDVVPASQIEPLVAALFDSADSLSSKSPQMFGVSGSMQAEFLVQDLLERLPKDEANATLDRLFSNTNGLQLPIGILKSYLGHQQKDRLESFLTGADLERWKVLFASRIAARAAEGKLIELPGSSLYLFLWRAWGDPEAPRNYVSELSATRDGALKVIEAFVQVAHTSNPNKRGETERPYIRHTDIANFIDPEALNTAIGATELSDLRLLRLTNPAFKWFERALNRRRQGQDDDGFRIWHDEEEDDD